MRKCSNCGYNQLIGTEVICPKCDKEIVYRCQKCGKELFNGKKKKCPLCSGKAKRLAGLILSCFGLIFSFPGFLLSIFYWILPTDGIPDPIPGAGFIDDIIVILIGIFVLGGTFITGIVLLVWGIIAVKQLSDNIAIKSPSKAKRNDQSTYSI